MSENNHIVSLASNPGPLTRTREKTEENAGLPIPFIGGGPDCRLMVSCVCGVCGVCMGSIVM